MSATTNAKQTDTACPLCEGTGWKSVANGAARKVARCECMAANRAERLLAAAHIPTRYEHCELENFDTTGSRAPLAAALLDARRFVEEYPVHKAGLLFVGDIGVGKTHLAVGVLKLLMREKSIPCLFYDYRELLKDIQNSFNPTVHETEMDVLRPVFDTEVLIIDELGAVKPSDWKWDTISDIINRRYNAQRTTIFTTNFPDLPESGLAGSTDLRSKAAAERANRRETLGDRITERMRSRLHEMCKLVEMHGDDFRVKVKSASFR
ncbi:MAG: ATP-binding protein [Candidatus Koribacter versatilis]|uniref:ATP-binding protein n=1 Tax=Candidatus Korobacter versatilis TaxID=658062 RepID=A0A932EQN6_9BACT|nr:ATP-binding protein [Candidatus Koribacter versatilis]